MVNSAQLGRVLDSLESTGLDKNTIITFIGDHGYQNGEKGQWCKTTTFELAMRIPMFVVAPDSLSDNWARGHVQTTVVESVDLMVTLADLAGLVTRHPPAHHNAILHISLRLIESGCVYTCVFPFSRCRSRRSAARACGRCCSRAKAWSWKVPPRARRPGRLASGRAARAARSITAARTATETPTRRYPIRPSWATASARTAGRTANCNINAGLFLSEFSIENAERTENCP